MEPSRISDVYDLSKPDGFAEVANGCEECVVVKNGVRELCDVNCQDEVGSGIVPGRGVEVLQNVEEGMGADEGGVEGSFSMGGVAKGSQVDFDKSSVGGVLVVLIT